MRNRQCSTGRIVSPAATIGIALFITATLTTLAPPYALADPLAAAPITLDAATIDAGADDSWWLQVRQNLAAREYETSRGPSGLQAPNRAHNLRVHFREGEIEIVPRDARRIGAKPWSWRWRTAAWGRLTGGSSLATTTAVTPEADGARIEYRRQGLVEWYENSPSGLEQGFVLAAPPGAGAGADGRAAEQRDGNAVCVEGSMATELRARMNAETNSIDFLDEHGACVMRYDHLVVNDATGRTLPSELALDGQTISILIDDTGATYPIVIDPIMSSPAWVETGTQSEERFGWAVATAGDVNGDGLSDVIVGAPWYEHVHAGVGRVELYLGTPIGLPDDPDWVHEGSAEDDHYGHSVSSAGDVNGDGYDDVVIGAEGHSLDTGRVEVFHGSHAGLGHSPDWFWDGERPGDHFGFDVATAGDTNGDGYDDVIIGAIGYNNYEGRGYVILGSNTGLRDYVTWNTTGGQVGAEFGRSVGTAGDVNGDGYSEIIVGAPYWSDVGDADEGAAYIFRGTNTGPINVPFWTFRNYIANSGVGNAVATAGDLNGDGYSDVIIGASQYDGGAGAVYIAMGADPSPEYPPSVFIEGDPGSRFGSDVGPAGDVNGDGYSDVLVGAYRETVMFAREGRAYVYLGGWAGVNTTPYWSARGNEADAMFGFAVATAGDVDGDGYSDVIVGAPAFGRNFQGQARQYHGGPDGLRETPGWVIESNQERAQFGYSVACAGDVNGDGFSDLMVGAPEWDATEMDVGIVALYLGSQFGLSIIPNWLATGDQFEDEWGSSVASAGDVNGDGYDDILIGSHNYTDSENEEGGAFLWMSTPGGGPNGTPQNAHWSAFGGQANSSFGYSVAAAGDVNGDGFGDIIVGAPDYTDGHNWEGGAFIYFGSETGPSADPDWFHGADQVVAHYGVSVASAGDFDGDGYSDVIVGADRYDHPTQNEGAAFVYLGSPDGPTTGAPEWFAQGDQSDCDFGADVASAGDVNGDGLSDVIIGARRYNAPAAQAGMAFVWYGATMPPPTGNPTNADWSHAGVDVNDSFGHDVSSAGDVNGDGFSDIVVSEQLASTDSLKGVVHVWYGTTYGLVEGDPDWSQYGTQAYGWFGWDVGSAGDVNGDGFTDVIVGAMGQSYPQEDEGRTYLYYGNDSRGISRIPQQMRSDFSAPIGLLCKSDASSAFGLRARGRTPMGRGDVRLVWEVKPFGTPFDGTGLGYGTWTETDAPAGPLGSFVVLTELVAGLAQDTEYHWRFRIDTESPYFPHSPWLTLPYNCTTELDLRTDASASVAGRGAPAHTSLQLSVHPNPVLARTTLAYNLPERTLVRLSIYDAEGRLIRRLVDGMQDAGEQRFVWDARDERGRGLASGVYFVRLERGAALVSQKILLMP